MNWIQRGVASVILLTLSVRILANPQGGEIVAGSATIVPSDVHQIITQESEKAVIDWRSFDIGPNQITEFKQPENGITLNRVIEANPSLIDGQLKANGQIWLINPWGMIIGKDAKIDVAGLLATTANIETQNFLNGHYHFLQAEGRYTAIRNEGLIKVKDSGIVALVAPGVENEGIIMANHSRIALGSGMEFTLDVLDLHGDGLIKFAVPTSPMTARAKTPDGRELKDAVSMSGKIVGKGNIVALKTSDAVQVVENLINMQGIIKAESAVQHKGEIILTGGKEGVVQVTGSMDVSSADPNGRGGNIKITGEKIRVGRDLENGTGRVLRSAFLDASGPLGGGEILIGGDYLGKNNAVRNAHYTIVSEGVEIKSDALTRGKGGKVIVFAEDTTRFLGKISAKGGAYSGDGGFVETSGLRSLQIHHGQVKSWVDASAPAGLAGTYLLDPHFNVNIDAFTANMNQSGGNPDTFTPTAAGATLNADQITNLLNAGTSVIVSTSNGAGNQAGDITVLIGPEKAAGAAAVSLTFQAGRDIAIFAPIIGSSSTLDLNFQAGLAGGIGAVIFANNVSTNGGNLTCTSRGVNVATPATLNTGTGNMVFNGNGDSSQFNASSLIGNNITLSNNATLMLGNVTAAGTLAIDNSLGAVTGAVTQTAGTVLNVNTLNVNTANSVTLTNANLINTSASFTNATANPVAISTATNLPLAASTVAGDFTATSAGSITQTGGIVNVGGATSLTANTGINLPNANNFTGAVTFNNANANPVQLGSGATLNLAASSTAGNFVATSNAGISQTGALTVPGTSTFVAAGIINLPSTNNFTGQVVLNGGHNVNVRANALVLGLSSAGQNFTASAAGSLRLNNNLTAGGTMTLSAPSGMTLGNSIVLRGGNIIFNNTLDGASNLTLDAGATGSITLNANVGSTTRLGVFTINNAFNFTNNATLNAASFVQSQGANLTSLGLNTLVTTGNASIIANRATGGVFIGGTLTLGVNSATLFGVVQNLPILFFPGTAPTSSGLITFNGVDLFVPTPTPTPIPVPPVPVPTPTVETTAEVLPAENLITTILTGANSANSTSPTGMPTGTDTGVPGQGNGGGQITTEKGSSGSTSTEKSTGGSSSGTSTGTSSGSTTTKTDSSTSTTTSESTSTSSTSTSTSTTSSSTTDQTSTETATTETKTTSTDSTTTEGTSDTSTSSSTSTSSKAEESTSSDSKTSSSSSSASTEGPVTPESSQAIDSGTLGQEGPKGKSVEDRESTEGPASLNQAKRIDIEGNENTAVSIPEEPKVVGNPVEGIDRSENTSRPLISDDSTDFVDPLSPSIEAKTPAPMKPEATAGLGEDAAGREKPAKATSIEGVENFGETQSTSTRKGNLFNGSMEDFERPKHLVDDIKPGKEPLKPPETVWIDRMMSDE